MWWSNDDLVLVALVMEADWVVVSRAHFCCGCADSPGGSPCGCDSDSAFPPSPRENVVQSVAFWIAVALPPPYHPLLR